MLAFGSFRDLDTTTLEQIKAAYTACVKALALNQSYAIGDKTLTRVNLPEAVEMLREVSSEIKRREDALVEGATTRVGRVFHPDFSGADSTD